TVAVLVVLLRRSERLHQQQTEFVASISHELNTPVTALRSAGENLRDGIVTDPAKLADYGKTIVRESTRLADLLGAVMDFAGMQTRPRARSFEHLDVRALVEEALAQSRWLIDE